MRQAGHVARMGAAEKCKVHKIVVGKSEGMGPTGRSRYKGIGCASVELIQPAQNSF